MFSPPPTRQDADAPSRAGPVPVGSRRLRLALRLLPIVWIGIVAGGFVWLWDYASAPGEAGTAPARWPRDSQIVPATDRPTLVMFAHPKCPCTRASMAELARVMSRCGERVAAHVLFYKPPQTTAEWGREAGLWEAAASIPGVQVDEDLDQQEARRFAASTSGHVVLYGADGSLLFQGGITTARGHEGDNVGRDAVVAWVTTGSSNVRQTNVFGCSLVHKPRSSGQE